MGNVRSLLKLFLIYRKGKEKREIFVEERFCLQEKETEASGLEEEIASLEENLLHARREVETLRGETSVACVERRQLMGRCRSQ